MLATEAEGMTASCEISPEVPLHAVTTRIIKKIDRAIVKGLFSRIIYFR